ncbi:MAG: 6-phosphogluconolactonase, partial [Bacteroidales bacterium]|nr:6-phosphogluconolactonase [Bacteroidales bacterium]
MEQDFFVDRLHVFVYKTRQELGADAASMAETVIVDMLKDKPELNIIFAAAPSQNEFLKALTQSEKIDWGRIKAYHMDEYIGLPDDAPQKFSTYLKEHLFDRVGFKTVNIINSGNPSPEDECMRYTCLLKSNPPDIVCLGIGEN